MLLDFWTGLQSSRDDRANTEMQSADWAPASVDYSWILFDLPVHTSRTPPSSSLKKLVRHR